MKRIESPVKKWPGYILLHDPIPLIHVAAFEEANQAVKKGMNLARMQMILLPTVLPCVAEWHLDGFPDPVTIENFPGTPRSASAALFTALTKAVSEIYRGDSEADPNE